MSQSYDEKRVRRVQYIRSVVGENVRKIRKEQGLTQKQMGDLLIGGPTHESYFRGIETGQKEFSLVRLVEIADTLGVTPSQLLEGI